MNNAQRAGIVAGAVAAFIMTAPTPSAAESGKAKITSASQAASNAIKNRTTQNLAVKQITSRRLKPSP